MQITVDRKPYDVLADHYAKHGWSSLPETPTMAGVEILAMAGRDTSRHLIEIGDPNRWVETMTDAIILRDGMAFETCPPAHA